MDPETCQLWGPGGKCFQPEKKLSDHVGRNEKCKVGIAFASLNLTNSSATLPILSLRYVPTGCAHPLLRCLASPARPQVVLKLQKRGAGAPAREPVISAEEQKNMMSYYHKKQEEMQKLAEANEDFSSSAWADPKALKGTFAGVGNVRVVGSGARGFNTGVM